MKLTTSLSMYLVWTTDYELITCQHTTFNITSTDTVNWWTIYSVRELSATVGTALLTMLLTGEGTFTEAYPFRRKDSQVHVHYLHIH